MRSTAWIGGLAALILPLAEAAAQQTADADGVRHVGKVHNRMRSAEVREQYFLDQEFDDAARRLQNHFRYRLLHRDDAGVEEHCSDAD